ncbi:hypothetical protein M9H77_26256 [Catharanthus roseus]|uniref:Uncharacterized protein n=1 Tax=Catharanthus roseus TaxID=4058 RepID=A0ACC0A966_CATRO|nr:hypothetical protein M9H77_26256 [Catharanthus roseus]
MRDNSRGEDGNEDKRNNKPKSITNKYSSRDLLLPPSSSPVGTPEQLRKVDHRNCNNTVSEKGKKSKSREPYLKSWSLVQRRVAVAISNSSGEPRRGTGELNTATAMVAFR